LFALRESAGRWSVASTSFLGAGVTLALHDARDGAIYAALEHGHFGCKLQRSDDGGAGWTELDAPAYPEKPEGLSDLDGMGGEVPWSTKKIWELASGGDDRPGRLWAGTIPGGLFVSDDRGASWRLIESLWRDERRKKWFGGGADWPGIHSISIDPRDSDRVLAAVSCGGVWETTDAGETWDVRAEGMRAEFVPPDQAGDPLIQDPHRMVACLADPDVLWVQHHNGIFRSTDGAASWRELEAEPSSFGFAVAAHPERPDTAWFVPGVKDELRFPVDGKLVVTRTRDGGESFEILRDGLPQEHAYDVVYRHALAVDGSGDRLAFGSTTGSLFVTADGGDRWERVSAHLPPIYAVTFA
jgi:photosystem II stability/assembly factor-like uncharacterized protein